MRLCTGSELTLEGRIREMAHQAVRCREHQGVASEMFRVVGIQFGKMI